MFRSFSFLFIFGLSALSVRAAPLQLTFEEALADALRSHPDLEPARLRIDEARGQMEQFGLRPNPELELGYRANRFAGGAERETLLGVSQRVPVGGRLRHEREIGRFAVDRSEAEVREAARLISADVRGVFIRLLAQGARIEADAEWLAAMERHRDFTERAAERGELPFTAAEDARIAAALAAHDLRRRETTLRSARYELHFMMGHTGEPEWQATGDVEDFFRPDLMEPTSLDRPDLEALRLDAGRASAETALSRAERRDDWTVSLEWEYESEPRALGGRQRDHFFGLRVSVPLPLFDRREGELIARLAAERRVRAQIEAGERRIDSQIETARAEVRSLRELLDALEADLGPLFEESGDLLRAGFESGEVRFSELFAMRERRQQLNERRLDLRTELALAYARLAAALGTQP